MINGWGISRETAFISPSAAYVRQWIWSSLFQIRACRLFGAKALYESILEYCYLDPWEQTSLEFDPKLKRFIYENAIENIVCKMAAISSRRGWLNITCPY